MINSRIEVQAERTVIIIGPMVTASLQKNDEKFPLVSFESLKSQLQRFSTHSDDDASRDGVLHSWLQETETFVIGNLRKPPIIERLLDLQRKGALLAYLYPDNIIEQALDREAITASDVQKWGDADHSTKIMHIYGVCTDVESMRCWQKDGPIMPDALANAFRNKLCICVGFSKNDVQNDLKYFLNQLPLDAMPHILFPCDNAVESTQLLCIPGASLPEAVCSMGDTSKAIGEMIEYPADDLGRPVSLLMANKTEYVKVAKALSLLPGMRFMMMNGIECYGLSLHLITVQVASKEFQQFWSSLVQPEVMDVLVNHAALAIVLNQSTFIWLSGGKLRRDTNTVTVGDLVSNSAAAAPGNLPASMQFTSQPDSHMLGMTTSLKQTKPVPRYTVVKKQKVDPKLFSEDGKFPLTSSILKRRRSLPHHPTFPPTHNIKGKPSSSFQPTTHHQLMLSRYIFGRKGDHLSMKREPKLLRRLLQEGQKEIVKPTPKTQKSIKWFCDWVFQRRKSLFVNDNQEWSSQVSFDLEKKLVKWERMRRKRLERIKQRAEEAERVRRSSLDSTASSTSDIIRQQLSAPSSATIFSGSSSPLSVQPPLFTAVNPYILPRPATNFTLGTPMMFQSPYLSSYPLLTPLPVNYLMSSSVGGGTPNLVLVSNGSLGGSSTQTISGSVASNQPTTSHIAPSLICSSSVPTPVTTIPSVATPVTFGSGKSGGRKHSNAEKNYSQISSLLMRKDTDPPPTKLTRIVSSPSSLSDERSDGEESNSEQVSSDSSENDEGQLPLWKFLLELLLSNTHSHLIEWSRIPSLEFHIKQPQEITKLWSTYKADKSLDYGKFKRAICYYCTKDKPILNSVSGKEGVYCFSSSMLYYINNRYSQMQKHNKLSVLNSSSLSKSRDLSGSQEVLVVD